MGITGVCASFAFVGCGSDDANTESTPQDSSTSGDTTSASDTSVTTDGAPSDSTMGDVTTDAPATCSADAGDGGALCPAGQWRDFAGMTCKACPGGAALTCPTSFDLTNTKWDATGKKLTVALAAGKNQIVSGKAKITYTTGDCYGASGPPSTGTVMTKDVDVAPSGDAFVVDFSAIDSNAKPCGTHELTLTDACCAELKVKVTASYDIEGGKLYLACPTMGDAGTDAAGGG
jgi:hypothetical protein